MRKEEFTKEDLKTGMLVQLRDGGINLVINDYLISKEDWGDLRCWDSLDFRSNGTNSHNDIVKVSNVLKSWSLQYEYWTKETLNNNLLWEREEEENVLTMEQIEKLTGLKNIKIICVSRL